MAKALMDSRMVSFYFKNQNKTEEEQIYF
jgi:hypothetical protein